MQKPISKIQKQLHCNPGLILWLILAIGFGLRVLYIEAPLVELFENRQVDTAAMAHNFYRHGFNIFYPELDWGMNGPGYVECEFPFYPFITAGLYLIFGIQECIGRMVSIFFSLFSSYFIFKFSKKYFSQKAALLSAFFFIICPASIYFSRAFIPEATMIFFSIAGLYYFTQWLDHNKWIFFWLAVLCCGLSFLIKIPTLYLLCPLLYLAYRKYKWNLPKQWPLWLFAVATLLPAILWYIHAYWLGITYHNTIGIWNTGYSKWTSMKIIGDFNILNKSNFYAIMAFRLSTILLTPIGLTLLVIGLFLRHQDKVAYFLHFWLLAIFAYMMVVASGNMTHPYYQFPIIPPASILIGQALSVLLDKKILSKVGIFIILTIFSFYSLYYIQPYYSFVRYNFLQAGEVADRIIPAQSLIAADGPFASALIYCCKRKGFTLWNSNPCPDEIEACRKKGASYYVSTDMEKFKIRTEFGRYMIGHYKVLGATDEFVIFDLRTNVGL